jgi:hypothetical protein
MQRFHEEHANALLERHVANFADELIEVEAAVIATKVVLARGGRHCYYNICSSYSYSCGPRWNK